MLLAFAIGATDAAPASLTIRGSATTAHAAPSDPWLDLTLSAPRAEETAQSAAASEESATPGAGLSTPICHQLESKFCRVVRVAEDADDTWDAALIAAIAIHESGFAGPVGFGICAAGCAGYQSSQDAAAAVDVFLRLVSSPGRYGRAWEARADRTAFLNALVDAGYAGVEGRGWPPKIIWLREWMLAHPDWKSD